MYYNIKEIVRRNHLPLLNKQVNFNSFSNDDDDIFPLLRSQIIINYLLLLVLPSVF